MGGFASADSGPGFLKTRGIEPRVRRYGDIILSGEIRLSPAFAKSPFCCHCGMGVTLSPDLLRLKRPA